MRRTLAFSIAFLFLVGALSIDFSIQSVKAQYYTNIYIKSDGRVVPDTAPIISSDNITYTQTADVINSTLIIERNDIIFDGNGFTLKRSPITGDFIVGILIETQNNITIRNTNLKGFSVGIRLYETARSKIINNTITDSLCGAVELAQSSQNFVKGNNIATNHYGIQLGLSTGNNVTGNLFLANDWAFEVWGLNFGEFINYIDPTNLVNGKPVYYLMNAHDLIINPTTYPDVGWLALVNSTNITVENHFLAGNSQGILLAFTNNSRIINNTIVANAFGPWLRASHNNTITGNYIENLGDGIFLGMLSSRNVINENILFNNWNGIYIIEYSNNNTVFGNTLKWNLYGIMLSNAEDNGFYHNDFIENGYQVGFEFSVLPNVWDDGYPSGGNYWSDYTGIDANGDGIGDSPRLVGTNNRDNYPLMAQYPSIHNVAIKNLTTSKTVIGQGYPLTIHVDIASAHFPETFNLAVYTNLTLIDSKAISLESGESRTETFTWNTAGWPRGTYNILIEADTVPGETFADDNIRTCTVKVTIPGDTNGDGIVNITDATPIGIYWMKQVPPAPSNADINCDDIINVKDATIIGTNWLKSA